MKSLTAGRGRRANTIRWTIGILGLVGLVAWLLAEPDPAAMQRQQVCQAWGITDRGELTKCLQSAELEANIIEPLTRAAIEREITEFNQGLAALTPGKTRTTDADYENRSLEAVARMAGGSLGFIMSNDATTFQSKGQRVKSNGVIVTNEPDPDNSEPRYFTLEAETHLQDTMPTAVNLDIESLNRYERQFVVDHCYTLSVTPCRATVLGKLDKIVGRGSADLAYVGIVTDQINIEVLDPKRANPIGMPSDRVLSEISSSKRRSDQIRILPHS